MHIKTLAFVCVFLLNWAVAAEQSPDSHQPTEYKDILGLMSVHESDPEAQAELILYVGRQIAKNNRPSPELRARLENEINDVIQGVKEDPDLFAGKDRQKILRELSAVREAVGNQVADLQPNAMTGEAPKADVVPKATKKLVALRDRAAAIALVIELSKDVAQGADHVVEKWLAPPKDVTEKQMRDARKEAAQEAPELPFIIGGMATAGGGLGEFFDRLVLVAPNELQRRVHVIFLRGHSIFANDRLNLYSVIPSRLTLDELWQAFPLASEPAKEVTLAGITAEGASIDAAVKGQVVSAIKAGRLHALGACCIVPLVNPDRLVLIDAANDYRSVVLDVDAK